MNPLKAEEAIVLQQHGLRMAKNEHAITRKVIQAVPVDKGDYRPDEVAKSAFDLAWHIAVAENRFIAGIVAGAFDFSGTRPEHIHTSADIVTWYTEQFETNYNGLAKLSSDQLVKIVDFRGMLQQSAVQYLQFAIHHTIHHRGQLSTYLRAMGAKVPSIYGESYDAVQERKAREAQAQTA